MDNNRFRNLPVRNLADDWNKELKGLPDFEFAKRRREETAADPAAIQRKLDQQEPGRYRVLTPEEVEQRIKPEAAAPAPQEPREEPVAATVAEQEGESGLLSDIGSLLAIGADEMALSLREGVRQVFGDGVVKAIDKVDEWIHGKGSEELLTGRIQANEERLTPETQAARKKAWVEEGEDGYKLGPAWSDWRSYAAGVVQSIPETAAVMTPGGIMARGVYLNTLARGGSAAAAGRRAAAVATVAGGLTEGFMGGGGTARSAKEAVQEVPDDVLRRSEAVRTLMAEGKSLNEARAIIAEDAATKAFVVGGVLTGVFGGLGDRVLAKILTEGAGSRLSAAVRGAVGEGVFEELPQSVAQQGAQNYAVQDADPNVNITDGMANAGAGGLVLGGIMGAGMGAAAGGRRPTTAPEQAEAAMEVPAGPVGRSIDAALRTAQAEADIAIEEAPPAPASAATPAPVPAFDAGTRVAASTPAGDVAGTIEEVEADGTVRMLSDDGMIYEFRPEDDVQIQPLEQTPPAPAPAPAPAQQQKPRPAPQQTQPAEVSQPDAPKDTTGRSLDEQISDAIANAEALQKLIAQANDKTRADIDAIRQEAVDAARRGEPRDPPSRYGAVYRGVWERFYDEESRRNPAPINADKPEAASKSPLEVPRGTRAARVEEGLEVTADGKIEKRKRVTQLEVTEPAKPNRPLSDMSEEELRDRLKYLASQAKQSGWNSLLTKARRDTENAIRAKVEERRRQAAPEPAEQSAPASEPVKWFGSQEKAAAWVAKQKKGKFEIVQDGRRFNVYERTTPSSTAQDAEKGADLVLKSDGSPFASRQQAERAAKNRRLEGYEPIAVEGGFALAPVVAQEAQAAGSEAAPEPEGQKATPSKRQTANVAEQAKAGSIAEPNLAAAKALLQEQREAVGNPRAESQVRRKARELAKRTPITDERTVLLLDTIATRLDMNDPNSRYKDLEYAEGETRPAKPQVAGPRNDIADETPVAVINKRTGQTVDVGIYRGTDARTGSARVEVTPGEISFRHPDAYEIRPISGDSRSQAPAEKSEPTVKAKRGRAGAAALKKLAEAAGLPLDDTANRDTADLIAFFDRFYEAGRDGRDMPRADIHPQDARAAYEAGRKDSKAASQAPKAKQPAAAPEPNPFANNKIFTADKVEAARARLRSKLGQLNSGIDPEVLIDGMTIAGAYIEAGVREFRQYARQMIEDFGDGIKPYLLSFWEGARNYPGLDATDMTGVEESAAAHAELMADGIPASEAQAVGEIAEKPKRRTRKTGKARDRVLTQDWGVDHIDGYSEDPNREAGNELKDAFLKEARSYMNAVRDELLSRGYEASGRGKPVSVNEGGVASSGEVSLTLRAPDGSHVYVHLGDTALRGAVPTTPSGIAIMFRSSKADGDTYAAKGANRWAPVDLSAADLANMVDNEARGTIATTAPKIAETSDDTQSDGQDAAASTAGEGARRAPADGARRNARGVRQDTDGADAGGDRGSESAGRRRRGHPGQSDLFAGQPGKAADAEQPVRSDRGAGDTAGDRADRRTADYRIQPGELTRDRSWKGVAERNVEIVELVKRLEAENRQATPEEKQLLTKFTGWGASEIANGIFPDRHGNYKPGWQELGERLKAALTDEEYAQAKRTTQYAHYTSESVIRAIYAGLQRLGFQGGNVLEPGAGVGLFRGLMPDGVAQNSTYTGVEYDTLTGQIATKLYPESNIIIGDYSKTKLPKEFFDAAIGNPPFSATKVMNDPEYRKYGFMLHDYFFAKTIDRVKPGGLLVFVTSKGTMDKANDRARKYLAERADLVGAIRLPQTAFKDNAGTEVVTDVLFLRKRRENEKAVWTSAGGQLYRKNAQGEAVGEPIMELAPWKSLQEVTTPQGPAHINEYFADHPEMVLGDHALTGSMYRANEYTVIPRQGVDIEQAFSEAVQRLPEGVYTPSAGSRAERAKVIERDFNPSHNKEGGVYLDDAGELRIIENGSGVPLTHRRSAAGKQLELKPREISFLTDYVRVRNALKQAQFDQLNDGPWEKSLAELNAAYDAFRKKHGPMLAHSITERENADGSVTVIRRFKNMPLLNLDVEGALAYAIEDIRPDGSIEKGPVLLGRTLKKPAEPEIRTTQDALFVSLNQVGRLDLDHVAELAGTTREAVIEEMGDAIYNDPSAGWVMADEYLSGNVVQKLREAEAAAKVNPALKRNVEALKAVQPKPLAPADITVQLGSHWVPASDVSSFAGEVLGDAIRVTYSPLAATWNVDGDGSTISEWGTEKLSSGKILEAVLNNRQIKVTWRDRDGNTHVDTEGTEKANDIAKKMREAFKRWIWQDATRADRLTKFYNEHFNNIVPRQFDGSHLTLPGVSLRFKLYPHQKRAIWRTIQEGNTYLAHSVGAGKTFTMIASGMEERRLGLSRKPMYVVPNHMLAQFSKEFLELYPTANIMVADEQNFHTGNRRRFVAQAALNDPDAIIITHSAFGRIGMSDAYYSAFIKGQIDEMKAMLDEADTGDRITRKQLERKIEQLERRLEAKQKAESKDKVLDFEELGVDRLYVDEAHEFRKLDFATNRGNVKGIDPSGSQKAMDLYMKVQHLEAQNPGRSLVMASGTPVTNTMGELYTVQRFFQADQLAADGLASFDAWSNHFGEVVEGFEQNAAGGYEVVSRFAKFVNVPDLMSRVRSFMDILTSEQLGELVQRPAIEGGQRQIVVTPTPDGYKAYQKELEARIRAIRQRSGPPKPGDDIILKVIADGRFSAIDMRFVDPTLPSDPNSKLNRVIDAIIEAYHESADYEYHTNGVPDAIPGASIMMFTDIGLGEASARNRGFDMKAWIEKRLVEGGVKREHIAFMRDHKQHAKKERLFADMREGRKRILIGGKDMETGVNAQKRLKYEFHLDAPWFPASVEQREGRIIRQGNQNKEVVIKAFATKGSYDSTMWGMNARKARFIEQAMTGDGSVRSMEDVSEASSFEMASALASGDERYLKLAGLKADVERLNRLYSAHMHEQRSLRSQEQDAVASIERLRKRAAEMEEALGRRVEIKAGEFRGEVDGTTYESREEFGKALYAAFKKEAEAFRSGEKVIGKLGGFEIRYTGMTMRGSGEFIASADMAIPGDPDALLSYPIDPEISIAGLGTRAANQVNRLDAELGRVRERIDQLERRLEQIRSRTGAEFQEMQELTDKQEQLYELERELAADSQQTEQQAAQEVAELSKDPQFSLASALGMSEDEFIAAFNPTGERISSEDRIILNVGDLSAPPDAKRVGDFKDRQGRNVQVLRDGEGNYYARQRGDILGMIGPTGDGETVLDVVQEGQGRGIGKGLTKIYLRDNPNAKAGGLSEAGERTARAAFRELKAESARRGMTDREALAALKKGPFGGVIDRLVETEQVMLLPSAKSLSDRLPDQAQAATLPDGRIALFTSRLNPQTIEPVLLHEAFHAGAEALLGDKEWKRLMGRLGTLYQQGKRSKGRMGEFWDVARQRIERAESLGDRMTFEREIEEFGAYAIEEYARAPVSIRKWVDSLIGAVKAWLLRRFGIQAGQVTPAQLRAIAAAALRSMAAQPAPEFDSRPLGGLAPNGDPLSVADVAAYGRGGEAFDWSNPGGRGLRGDFSRETKIGDTTIIYGVGSNGTAEIISVRTPQAKRGAGSARRALEAFLAEADQRGLQIKLQASPLDKKTSLAKLVQFYQSLGFELTGRKINAAGDPEMVRAARNREPAGGTFDADTITVDGKQRSTRNSEGRPIATTEEGIRNFWRWFGDEGITDGDNRPSVFIHGGDADFTGIEPGRGEFGGIFVLEGDSSGYRDRDFHLYLRGPIATSQDINSFFYSSDDGGKAIIEKAIGKEVTDDELDAIHNAVVEEGWSDASFEDAVGAYPEDAYAVMQRIRAAIAREAGYTAVDIYDEFGGDTILVVDPLAIKSATDNRGTFDPSNPDIRYSVSESTRQAEVDGQQRPATNSNGQPIAQTEQSLRNFWQWFGDSKVVDAQGKPLVLYHGTNAEFTTFNTDGLGAFFTSSKDAADGYGYETLPVYLALNDPLVVDANGSDWSEIEYTARLKKIAAGAGVNFKGYDGGLIDMDTLAKIARKAGYEGLVVNNVVDAEGFGNSTEGATVAVAFRPEQIKSAIGNTGSFDPANADIRFSLAEDQKHPYTPDQKRAALAGAEKGLRQAKASRSRDFDGGVIRDLGAIANWVQHPYTIASMHEEFTPVFLTAQQQGEMRDSIIAEFYPAYRRYRDMPRASRQRVNKVLELGRLLQRSYSEQVLENGIVNPGTRTVVAYDEHGNRIRRAEPVHAALSKPGERIHLTEKERAAYLGLRSMFDSALDRFADQVLVDMGLDEFVGQPNRAKAIMDSISDDMPANRIERLTGAAQTMAEIEQAKRTGYVPFSRYGRYAITVKEDRARLEYAKNPEGGWIVRGVPEDMTPFMEEIGATYNEIEGGWQVDRSQRQALNAENERTVYSEKVELGIAAKVLDERRAEARGDKIESIRAVREAKERIVKEWVAGNPNRRVTVIDTQRKTPEGRVRLSDIDALADLAQLDNDTWMAIRDQFADAVKGRGFRKHFFHSDNVPGYTTDFERAIGDYIGGMAGHLSRRHFERQWEDAISGVRGRRLHKYASDYRDYVNSPQEEYAMLRQVGFLYYIAGNVSTAALNATQVPIMTMPALSSVAPQDVAAREVARAYRDVLKMTSLYDLYQRGKREEGNIGGAVSRMMDMFDPNDAPADVREEVKAAWDEGYFSPQFTHEVMGFAGRSDRGAKDYFEKSVQGIAATFTYVERLNRLVSFIAAVRVAKRKGMKERAEKALAGNALARHSVLGEHWSPRAFGEFIVHESQFLMGKYNRSRMLRSHGAAIFQFMSFVANSLQAWYRWSKLQGTTGKMMTAASIAAIVALSGIWGAPGLDHLRDLFEKAYKAITGEDKDLKTGLRQWIAEVSDSVWLAEVATKGGLYPLGIDMTRRVGFMQIAPDTSSVTRALGIPADLLIGRPTRAVQKASQGDAAGAVGELAPNFIRNAIIAGKWREEGVRTSNGTQILTPEQVPTHALWAKALGFQPSLVTEVQDYLYAQYRAETSKDDLRARFANRIASAEVAAMRNDDPARQAELEAEIDRLWKEVEDYNDNLPDGEAPLEISAAMLRNRIERMMYGPEARFGKERKDSRETADKLRELFRIEERLKVDE